MALRTSKRRSRRLRLRHRTRTTKLQRPARPNGVRRRGLRQEVRDESQLKNAFGKCVSGKSKDDKDEQDEDKGEKSSGAAKACKAERASGAEAFAKKYGTNHNLKNAFGKCVSGKSE